jgi:hypothetical protein
MSVRRAFFNERIFPVNKQGGGALLRLELHDTGAGSGNIGINPRLPRPAAVWNETGCLDEYGYLPLWEYSQKPAGLRDC